ncbi:MAG: hypothetical protein ACFFCW_47765 [Candidatus Hodarchaeota archaeon]
MIDILREIHGEIKSLRKDINAERAKTISKKTLRQRAEALGTKWFSEVSEPLTNTYGFSPDLLQSYSQSFARLIKISAPNNLKKSYLDTLGALATNFRDELIIPVQKRPKPSSNVSLLANLLEGLPDPNENEYLKEAVNCARHHYYRAAVVLGWCAAIDRIHRTIEKISFGRFNVTSASMASQTKGRFKRFNSPQNVGSMSELREVFDTVILWILEGMQLIDSNQQTRLRSCFDFRCQCAHPGDAPVTEYNLLSYFSDLNEIVFKNPTFQI